MARAHLDAGPEEIVRRERDCRAEALDLKRPRQLTADAAQHSLRSKDGERQVGEQRHTDRERRTDDPLSPAATTPDVSDGERKQDDGIQLRRDRCTKQAVAEPVPVVHERGEREGREHRRPEVEARQDHRPDRERRERDERERPEAEAETSSRERDRDDHAATAERHQPLEDDAEVRVRERRREKHGQCAGRVLDCEVAVGHLTCLHRLAVALVDGRVDDLLTLVEADVDHTPRDEEQQHGERRAREVRGSSGHGRAARRSRRGRTTGGRGRTSASARARTRRSTPR